MVCVLDDLGSTVRNIHNVSSNKAAVPEAGQAGRFSTGQERSYILRLCSLHVASAQL